MKPENQEYIHFYGDELDFTTMYMNSFTSAYGLLPAVIDLKIIQIVSMRHTLS